MRHLLLNTLYPAYLSRQVAVLLSRVYFTQLVYGSFDKAIGEIVWLSFLARLESQFLLLPFTVFSILFAI